MDKSGNLYIGDAGNQEIVRQGTPRHWRRCGGYNLDRLVPDGGSFLTPPDRRFNLAKLVCGGEGGLAVMTEVTLGLVSAPASRGLALLHFDSLHRALSAVPTILEARPSAVELLDHLAMQLCRGVRYRSAIAYSMGRFVSTRSDSNTRSPSWEILTWIHPSPLVRRTVQLLTY